MLCAFTGMEGYFSAKRHFVTAVTSVLSVAVRPGTLKCRTGDGPGNGLPPAGKDVSNLPLRRSIYAYSSVIKGNRKTARKIMNMRREKKRESEQNYDNPIRSLRETETAGDVSTTAMGTI
jgi:hypothetical protein